MQWLLNRGSERKLTGQNRYSNLYGWESGPRLSGGGCAPGAVRGKRGARGGTAPDRWGPGSQGIAGEPANGLALGQVLRSDGSRWRIHGAKSQGLPLRQHPLYKSASGLCFIGSTGMAQELQKVRQDVFDWPVLASV